MFQTSLSPFDGGVKGGQIRAVERRMGKASNGV